MPDNKPHDALFKATFSQPEAAIGYIIKFLPNIAPLLNFERYERLADSYIQADLAEEMSDITYRFELVEKQKTGKNKSKKLKKNRTVSIAFLFEHKSFAPKYPHLQLMRYLLNKWMDDLKQLKHLEATIPIIIYHGQKTWHYKPFHTYFEDIPSEILKYIPNFDYHLTDISHYT